MLYIRAHNWNNARMRQVADPLRGLIYVLYDTSYAYARKIKYYIAISTDSHHRDHKCNTEILLYSI
jgi:hypothetical protein